MKLIKGFLMGLMIVFLVIGILDTIGVLSIYKNNALFVVPIVSLGGIFAVLRYIPGRKKLA